uniref:Uncharacterized protein n=1 Tax=Meloidogyne incognita TaxID=6306 RepID=A0A914LUW1_MELIC
MTHIKMKVKDSNGCQASELLLNFSTTFVRGVLCRESNRKIDRSLEQPAIIESSIGLQRRKLTGHYEPGLFEHIFWLPNAKLLLDHPERPKERLKDEEDVFPIN